MFVSWEHITMNRLAGKVAIVTGGASGLGESSASLMVREGAQVVITDINVEAGEALVKELGPKAFFMRHDVSKESEWIEVIADTEKKFGRLDVLVNNAGVVVMADVEHTTEEQWRFAHAVGTDGTFYGCKHAIGAMRRAGGGSIINMSSLAGIRGYPAIFAYSASKGAIAAMSRSVAVYCAQERLRIRCNSIHPGIIRTPLVEAFQQSMREAAGTEELPFDKASQGRPDDVGWMVVYLASDESKHVNGTEMVIDNSASVTEGFVPA
jgi:3(or 17)beta-hydroxysteroid dehydrogenase